jgi:hypothetical protein
VYTVWYFFLFRLELAEGSAEGDLSLALLTGNMELAVDLAVQQAKWADALILAAQVSERIAAFMRFKETSRLTRSFFALR